MGAIQDYFGSGEACLLSVKAGADVLLAPLDYKESFDMLLDAVRAGDISEDRIDESVLRILKAKAAVSSGPLLKW